MMPFIQSPRSPFTISLLASRIVVNLELRDELLRLLRESAAELNSKLLLGGFHLRR